MGYPIDIVIPWVDGSDPAWRAERAKYDPSATSDNSEERFRDWDTFRYWFRCIEKNAPWVRTIHFVTWGHLPGWLDPSHPKLHIVNHRDFIPEEYLPAVRQIFERTWAAKDGETVTMRYPEKEEKAWTSLC